MNELRLQMIDAVLVPGFSPRTHKSYLAAMSKIIVIEGLSATELVRSCYRTVVNWKRSDWQRWLASLYPMPRNRRSANGKLGVQVSTIPETVSQVESEPLHFMIDKEIIVPFADIGSTHNGFTIVDDARIQVLAHLHPDVVGDHIERCHAADNRQQPQDRRNQAAYHQSGDW